MKEHLVIVFTLSFLSVLNCDATIGAQLSNAYIAKMVSEPNKFLNFMASATNRTCDDSATSIIQFINSNIEDLKFGTGKKPVIILGMTGTGKSTLGLLLTGAKLTGEETFPGSRKFRLVDENDLISGNTTTESKTLIPDLMIDYVDDKMYPFYDCPGFSDTRSVKHDILAMYSIYELLNHVDAAKFLITAAYSTVESFLGDRSTFTQLSEHIIFLLKDVNKYRDSILFVVTKVPNESVVDDDGNSKLIPDDSVLASIGHFLQQAKNAIIEKNDGIMITDQVRQLNKQKIDFIDILSEQNEDKKYVKIGILRLATSAGPVEKMKLLQNEKTFIRSILYDETSYVSTDNGNFGVAISTDSGNCMRDLMDEMHNYLVSDIRQIDNQIEQFYQKLEEGNFDLEFVYDKILLGYRTIQPIEFKENQFLETLKQTIDVARILGIDIQVPVKNIEKNLQIIRFFETVSDYESQDVLNIESKFTKSISHLTDSKDWYAFMIRLHDALSQYDNYDKAKESNLTEVIAQCSNKQNFGKMFNEIGLEQFMSRIDKKSYLQVSHIKVHSAKLGALQMILEKTLTAGVDKTCSSNKLTVKGYNVRLKDVLGIECAGKINFIEVFALNTIFIDENVNKTGEKVQLSIIAPTWEIFGRKKIILDGDGGQQHPIPKAAKGERPFLNGKNGETGLPGGSSGHFLGIGNTFVNVESLEISTSGGQGGIGQHGGNAVDSSQGRDPDVYGNVGVFSPPSRYVRAEENSGIDKGPFLRSVNNLEAYWGKQDFQFECLSCSNAVSFNPCYCDYRIVGQKGESGGDGGNGGVGGVGGNAGTVVMIGLNETPNFQYFNKTGVIGPGGKGGDGARENRHGNTILITYGNDKYYHYYVDERDQKKGMGIHCMLMIKKHSVGKVGDKIKGGKNGIDGKSELNATQPEIIPFTRPSQTINDYKNYLRENLSNSIKKLELAAFVADFDKNENISSLYDTLGLVNELQNIEHQYLQLRNEISFIPHLKSLSHRIVEHSKSGVITLEDKKVLSYLYTATSSKICAINNNLYHNPVINLLEYMETMITNIKSMRDNKKQMDIADHRSRYKRDADEKIKSAIGFIENQIKPEINVIFTKIEDQFAKLLKETLEKKAETKEELKEEEEKKKELEKAFLFKQILWQIKIVSFGIQFLGPVAGAVSTAVTAVAGTVESLAMEKSEERGGKLIHIGEETGKLVNQLKTIYDEKDKIFKKSLEDMKKEVEEKADKDDPDWKNIKKDVETAKPDESLAIESALAAFRDGDKKRKGLIDSLGSKIKDWAKKAEKGFKVADEKVDFAKRWATVLKIAEFYKDINTDVKGDIKKIEAADATIAAVEAKLQLLEKYEESIYDTMVPLVEQIEANMADTVNKFNGKSHVELDVGKWRVKDSLQDIKDKFRQLTSGFKIEESLQGILSKLESAIEIVIDVYDRIDLYSDNKKLGDYIADIGSAGSLEINVKNEELQTAIRELEQIIRTNVLLEQFELITNELKAHQFPFAQFFLAESQSLLKLNDTESSISEAIQQTEKWKNQLKLSIISISKFDKEIYSNIWFGRDSGNPPFYTWKNSEIKNQLARLLDGEAITIKADITKGLNFNALKYNDIGIHFKAISEESQKKLNVRLESFDVRLEMEGYQYYRCADKFFNMPVSENIVIDYSFKKNPSGTGPLRKNTVYDKIQDSFFLSPYGMWRIQLINATVDQDFFTLKEFKNHLIDLELAGRAWYFKNPSSFSADICSDELGKFYDLDNTIFSKNVVEFN